MIVQKCDLESNQGLSSYSIGDKIYTAQQNHNVFDVFKLFLTDVKPHKILEIGTAQGGLTSFINDVGKKNNLHFKIISVDIYSHPWYDDIRNEGVDIIIENIFDWKNEKIINQKIIDFLSENKRKIIFCDGGDKIKEFKILSHYLNRGDFILAHDYVDNEDNFLKNYKFKIWNWHEISDQFIDDTCNKYNLISYKKEIFDPVVWVCKQKV